MSPLSLLLQNIMHVYNEVWPFPLSPDLPHSPPNLTTAQPLAWTMSCRSPVNGRQAWPWAKVEIQENKAVPSCSSTCWNFVFSNIWRRSSREWIRMIREIFHAILSQMVLFKHIPGEDKYRSLQHYMRWDSASVTRPDEQFFWENTALEHVWAWGWGLGKMNAAAVP